jgi:hypothetical protein
MFMRYFCFSGEALVELKPILPTVTGGGWGSKRDMKRRETGRLGRESLFPQITILPSGYLDADQPANGERAAPASVADYEGKKLKQPFDAIVCCSTRKPCHWEASGCAGSPVRTTIGVWQALK